MQINEQGGERKRTGESGVTRVVVESAVQKSDRESEKKLVERKEEGKRERTQRKNQHGCEARRERGKRGREEREREIKERTDARECNLF